MNEPLSKLEIENLDFVYQGLVDETEFSYEYWQKQIFGQWLEITNEYEANGSFKNQSYSFNDLDINKNFTKENFLKLIELLKTMDNDIN